MRVSAAALRTPPLNHLRQQRRRSQFKRDRYCGHKYIEHRTVRIHMVLEASQVNLARATLQANCAADVLKARSDVFSDAI